MPFPHNPSIRYDPTSSRRNMILALLIIALTSMKWTEPFTSPVAFSTSPATRLISNSKKSLVDTHILSPRSGGARKVLGTWKAMSSEGVIDVGDVSSVDHVVCGAGPAGLLTAVMLARKFPAQKVKVFDRLQPPPSPNDESVWSDVAKFYLIGLGSRGQKALSEFGVWDEVKEVCTSVLGRKDWAPDASYEDGVEVIFTDRPVTTQVLPREKLVGVLNKHIIDNYSDQIELNYGYEVAPIDFDADSGSSVLIRVSKCEENVARINPNSQRFREKYEPEMLCDTENSYTLSTKFLVGADGTARTVASEMERTDRSLQQERNPLQNIFSIFKEKPFSVTRYVDDNRRIYKTVPMKLPSEGWRPDLNYSSRSKNGRVVFDALPANRKGEYCGVLLLKEEDDVAKRDSDPKLLREVFDEYIPWFGDLVDDDVLKDIAKKPPSFLPSFRYAGPRLHQGGRTVILGDCAHTVKPYFGLGANTALEDVQVLSEIIDKTQSITEAGPLFSKRRAGEAEELVKLSRDFDRPGFSGFISFILPLILDSISHGMAPKIFAPNTIAMLQKEGVDFRGIRRRKRLDRLMQVGSIGLLGTTVVLTAKAITRALSRATGRGSATVAAGMVACVAGFVALRRFSSFLLPNMAPADVLNKTRKKDTTTGSRAMLPARYKKVAKN